MAGTNSTVAIITPLDAEELRRIGADIRAKGIRTIAVSSVFSPVNAEMEKRAGDILAESVPGAHITLSSDIGRIGLLERENAAIMNACLRDLSRIVMGAFRAALDRSGIRRRFYLTQNDGTLMDAELRRAVPGAHLRQRSDQLDARRGVPVRRGGRRSWSTSAAPPPMSARCRKASRAQASTAVEIGGVRTNFRMPDVFSIGLGGGSLVVEDRDGGVTVGPRSVGYRLTERVARVRRQDADRDRHRRCRRPGRDRRPARVRRIAAAPWSPTPRRKFWRCWRTPSNARA